MNGYKKHLISQRIPANSFKSERVDSFKSEAPATMTGETVPSGRKFSLKSILGAGNKWLRNKDKGEPGAPAGDSAHQPPGMVSHPKVGSANLTNPRATRQVRNAVLAGDDSNEAVFFTLLKEKFFWFMESVFLLDSPQFLVNKPESKVLKPLTAEIFSGTVRSIISGFWPNSHERYEHLPLAESLSMKITSIAAKYRIMEQKSIMHEPSFPGSDAATKRPGNLAWYS